MTHRVHQDQPRCPPLPMITLRIQNLPTSDQKFIEPVRGLSTPAAPIVTRPDSIEFVILTRTSINPDLIMGQKNNPAKKKFLPAIF